MDEQELDGLWQYTAYEEGGVKRVAEQVATMAELVLLVGDYLPGWSGLWAAVAYGYEEGSWTEAEVRASCRHIILGGDREGVAPASDFYLLAGGRFRAAPQRSVKEIDFEQYWRGEVLPCVNLGLYRLDGERLTLCLAEPGKPRPSGFHSTEHAPQGLGELVRTSRAGPGMVARRKGTA